MFSYVSPEERIPMDHPLRETGWMCDEALRKLSPPFGRLYSRLGSPEDTLASGSLSEGTGVPGAEK
jgi:hypothetical protein